LRGEPTPIVMPPATDQSREAYQPPDLDRLTSWRAPGVQPRGHHEIPQEHCSESGGGAEVMSRRRGLVRRLRCFPALSHPRTAPEYSSISRSATEKLPWATGGPFRIKTSCRLETFSENQRFASDVSYGRGRGAGLDASQTRSASAASQWSRRSGSGQDARPRGPRCAACQAAGRSSLSGAVAEAGSTDSTGSKPSCRRPVALKPLMTR
jgi:hypothetical protein